MNGVKVTIELLGFLALCFLAAASLPVPDWSDIEHEEHINRWRD